jgi:hypothetical protein
VNAFFVMAIYFNFARMLLSARASGVSFGKTLMIANLKLYLSQKDLTKLANEFSKYLSSDDIDALSQFKFGESSKSFFERVLGATSVTILDNSDYEGAALIHDLNKQFPIDVHQQFDSVIDGGTLEHVFNFPVAISNLMNSVKLGGSVFLFAPANNLCGHGFYQFSPDVFFRAFSLENGFLLYTLEMYQADMANIFGLGHSSAVYTVVDPAKSNLDRLRLPLGPIVIMVAAKKIHHTQPFSVFPQQSSYVRAWSSTEAANWSIPSGSQPRRRMGFLLDSLDRLRVKFGVLSIYHAVANSLSSSFRNTRGFRKSS